MGLVQGSKGYNEDVTLGCERSTATEVAGKDLIYSRARRVTIAAPRTSPVFLLVSIDPDGKSSSEIVLERYSIARWRSWRQVERGSNPTPVLSPLQKQKLDSVCRAAASCPDDLGQRSKADQELTSFLTAKVIHLESTRDEKYQQLMSQSESLVQRLVEAQSRLNFLSSQLPGGLNSKLFRMPDVPTKRYAEESFHRLLRRRALVEVAIANENSYYAEQRHYHLGGRGLEIKHSQDRLSDLRAEFKKLNQAVDRVLQNPNISVQTVEQEVVTPVREFSEDSGDCVDGKWFKIRFSCTAGDKTPEETEDEVTEG
jgi:hypothetical protein